MGARILLIEDNQTNMELMHYLLEAAGHQVRFCENAERALEALDFELPDLILCDIQLPGVDGLEFSRRLRSRLHMSRLPLVAVTAFAMKGDRERILAVGFDGYIAKPINPETFSHEIEHYLKTNATASQALKTPVAKGNRTGRDYRILLVDNVATNLDFEREALESSGYRVSIASSMDQAICRLNDTQPDLIVSDVCMEDGDGFDFIQRVKSNPAWRGIPFVFLTSTRTDSVAKAQGLRLGADKFLYRPIEVRALLAEVASCLVEESLETNGQNTGN